jgi:MtN3 and saliva related transmembrane protein
MDPTAILGWIATSLTTISFVPQAVATIRSKSTAGISLGMYVLFVLGVCIWIVYGVVMGLRGDFWGALPIWVGNSVTLFFSSIVLGFKIHNVRTGKEPLSDRVKKTKEADPKPIGEKPSKESDAPSADEKKEKE